MRETSIRPWLLPALAGIACLGVADPGAAQVQTSALAFETEGFDLETGAVIDLSDPDADPAAADFQFAYNADRAIHAVLFQAEDAEIALVSATPFEYVSASDIASLTFTPDIVDEPCGGGDTVVLRTAAGSVFKIGNLQEDASVVVFDYELLEGPQAGLSTVAPGTPVRVASASSAADSAVPAARGVAGDLPPSGVDTEAWRVITRYIERDQYGARGTTTAGPDERVLEAANPAQGYTTRFTREGIHVRIQGTDSELGLTLTGWGYEEALRPVAAAPPEADGQRVEYVRGPLTEWYVNRASGLEHGFTLAAPPSGPRREGHLRFELALSGPLVAQASEESIRFQDAGGEMRLRYAGLKAWDATGRQLPARMALAGDRLTLEVEDARAAYPVTVDPTIVNEDAKLLASDLAGNDQLGVSVAVSGDIVVAGARLDDDNGSESGSAYVFERPVGGWAGTLNQVAKLLASDGAAFDNFGNSVAISGDTVVVGSLGDDDLGTIAGSAYVFEEPVGGWAGTLNQAAKLLASDGAAFDTFGEAVAVSGGTVVVRAPGDDDKGLNSGSAYLFEEPVGGWAGTLNQAAKLVASDGAAGDFTDPLGQPVAVSGGTVVLGAAGDDDLGTNSGSAYVFEKPLGGWAGTVNQAAKLRASDGAPLDLFGNSVGVSGDTVVAGAPLDDDQGSRSGSAYVFEEPVGGWAGTLNEAAKLLASDGSSLVQFGHSVAISGDRVILGTPIDHHQGPRSGSAYVLEKPPGGWAGTLNEDFKLLPSDGLSGDRFGTSVDVSANTVVVGAFWDNARAGSAYVFQLAPSNQPPACSAAAPVSGECGGATTTVTGLDGSASSDPDGDPLTFAWTTDCPGGVFDDPASATPTLTVDSLAPGVCGPLACGATLTVSDGSESDTCPATSVSVDDTAAPTLSQNAGPATLECGVDTYSEPGATAADACDSDVAVTIGGDAVDPGTVGSYTVTYDGADDCGNAAAQESRTVTVADTLPPSATCPAGIPLVLDANCEAQVPDVVSQVSAADECTDAGALSITQDLAPGLLVGPGSHTVTVTVTDGAGHSAECQTLLTAPFEFNGFLPPVNGGDATGGAFDDPVRSFKLRSTIPVKFEISCSGVPHTQGVHTLQAIHYSSATNSDPPLDATPQDAATTGNEFRLTDDQWHYNLDTEGTGMSKGQWKLEATLSDGTTHFVWIQVK